MIFLIFWIFFFQLMFKIAGSNVQEDAVAKSDYSNLDGGSKQLMEVWRNTIGDL